MVCVQTLKDDRFKIKNVGDILMSQKHPLQAQVSLSL